MSTTTLIAKHTILTTLRSRSLWVIALFVPAFLMVFQVFSALRESGVSGGASDSADTAKETTELKAIAFGLVDEANLLDRWPAQIPAERFVRFSDLASAREALEAGQIDQFVYLPSEYLADGRVLVYDREYAITIDGSNAGLSGPETIPVVDADDGMGAIPSAFEDLLTTGPVR